MRRLIFLTLGALVCVLLYTYFLLFWLRFNFFYERAWFTIHRVVPILIYLFGSAILLMVAALLYGKSIQRLLLLPDTAWVLVIFSLAVSIRVLHIALIPTQPVSDFRWYHDRAINLLTSGIYGYGSEPTATFPPGTSLFLAAIYAVIGTTNTLYPKLVQAILGAGSVVLLYYMVKKSLKPSVAKIAALMLTFYPGHIVFTSVLASENLFTFLNLLFLYLLLAQPLRRSFNYLGAGLGIGLSALTRPVGLPLPFLVLVDLLIRLRLHEIQIRKFILYLLAAIIGYSVVVTPWGVRNYMRFKTFSIASSSGGINLWIGNNPNATGLWMDMRPQIQKIFGDLDHLNVYERDRLFRDQALSFIAKHPQKFVRLYIKKFLLLFSGDTEVLWWSMTGDGVITDHALQKRIANLTPLIAAIFNTYFFLILGLATLSIPLYLRGLGRKYPWSSTLLVLYIGYFAFIYPVFFSGQRFHFNLMTIMIAFACIALAEILEIPEDSALVRSEQASHCTRNTLFGNLQK